MVFWSKLKEIVIVQISTCGLVNMGLIVYGMICTTDNSFGCTYSIKLKTQDRTRYMIQQLKILTLNKLNDV